MKVILSIIFCSLVWIQSYSQTSAAVSSPTGDLKVDVTTKNGKPVFSVAYKGIAMLDESPLGLITNEGRFDSNMVLAESVTGKIDKEYTQEKIKRSHVKYQANTLKCTFKNPEGKAIAVVFQVSANDIAFRYELPVWGERITCIVEQEATGFRFPSTTSTFLSPMMKAMGGFARSAPSYESDYAADAPMEKSTSPEGYVFPGLFRIGNSGWVLISETGVSSLYCASHLSGFKDGLFNVEYPDPKQNNGFGSTGAQLALPGSTPWRTITIGESLKPIVETTIPFDVVEPLFKSTQPYDYGRGTWSWIVWQDESMNFDDQIKYIDLAAAMDYEYILIDAWWDARIGYNRMEELIQYARSKDVDVFLWYNSNGAANDAFMSPINKMNTSIARRKEMKWLREAGVKGLKVDFFGGDKQQTMALYEDILSDANEYGLMVIFHGATLPRGWERMYPNFVGSEAVLASEMLIFSQDVRNKEAFYAALHPFIRNTVASMEFGGVLLNDFLNRGNQKGQERLTTDAFQLATSVLFQNPVQMFALTPNNLTDVPQFEIDFMRKIPTTWDETLFIDGYPGRYCVIARRHGQKWYIAGVNAGKSPMQIKVNLGMFSGSSVAMYNDDKNRQTSVNLVNIPANGDVQITVQPNGGFVITK